ncbi:MAG TPA: hypothetical protein VJ954_03150, partial [Ignavibacteriaceae bacterium]|nr:hypothetical protein [Ignavibacteriaceae bacterium]
FDPRLEGLNFELQGVEPHPVPVSQNKWYDVKIEYDCTEEYYNVWLNGVLVRKDIELAIETEDLERMVFRSGSWRSDVRQFLIKGQPSGPGLDTEDLAGAANKVPKSEFWIDNVKTSDQF